MNECNGMLNISELVRTLIRRVQNQRESCRSRLEIYGSCLAKSLRGVRSCHGKSRIFYLFGSSSLCFFIHIFSFFVHIYFFNFCFSLHDFSLFLYFVRFLFRLFLKQIKDGNLLTDLSSQATNIAGMVRTDHYL